MKNKKSNKKNIFKFNRHIVLVIIAVLLAIFIIFTFNKIKNIYNNKNSNEIEGNVLYSGIHNLKKVYFIKDRNNPIIYESKENIAKDINVKLVKSKREVYRTEEDIHWTNSFEGEKYLFMVLNTENENIILKMDLKTNKVEEVVKEKGIAFYSFKVDQNIENYLVGTYVPVYIEGISDDKYLKELKGDRFIINLDNNKKINIEKENIAGDIKIDIARKKAMWNKVKKEYVNCLSNKKDFPNACHGMYEESGRYFHFVATEEMVEVSLP